MTHVCAPVVGCVAVMDHPRPGYDGTSVGAPASTSSCTIEETAGNGCGERHA